MTDLAAIVGAAHVSRGSAADTVGDVVPRQVVRPGSIPEVQTVVRAVAAAGERLLPCGAGAHLDLGAPPARIDVLLQLDRLNRIVDHQAADMTATVEAGCSLNALDEVLARAGQWLPLDPPQAADTTVGGLVAANLSGPLRASQGTARDLVIGLRTVSADGTLVAGGGRVVKNVAGYDLPKLHIGALGTLGVIVEVTWKVRPRPAAEAAVVIGCRSVEEAGEVALAMRDLVEPYWLEAVSADVLPAAFPVGAAVVVGIAGMMEEIEAWRAAIASHAASAIDVEDGRALRLDLGNFPIRPADAVIRVATLPTAVGAVMTLADHTARSTGGNARCTAHASNGVVTVAVDGSAAVSQTVIALRTLVAAHGGTAAIDRAAPAVKASLGMYGALGDGAGLMRAIRDQFDPRRLFARHVLDE